jgi:hypothetical protein
MVLWASLTWISVGCGGAGTSVSVDVAGSGNDDPVLFKDERGS